MYVTVFSLIQSHLQITGIEALRLLLWHQRGAWAERAPPGIHQNGQMMRPAQRTLLPTVWGILLGILEPASVQDRSFFLVLAVSVQLWEVIKFKETKNGFELWRVQMKCSTNTSRRGLGGPQHERVWAASYCPNSCRLTVTRGTSWSQTPLGSPTKIILKKKR